MKQIIGYIVTTIGLVGLIGSTLALIYGGGKIRRWWILLKHGHTSDNPLLGPGIKFAAAGVVGFVVTWTIFDFGRGMIP